MSQPFPHSQLIVAHSPGLQHRLETVSDTESRELGRSRRAAGSSPDTVAQYSDSSSVTETLHHRPTYMQSSQPTLTVA